MKHFWYVWAKALGEKPHEDDDISDKNKQVAVSTVEWFFKNYDHSSILSYHMVDTSAIPEKYNVDYNDYKIN